MSKVMDNARLVLEYVAVTEHFGDRAMLCTDPRRERVWWKCRLPSGSRGRTVLVFYPADYPNSPPKVVFIGRLRRNTPHVMFGNVLDVRFPKGLWSHQYTAATAMRAAVQWFEEYRHWKRVGRWPATRNDLWEGCGPQTIPKAGDSKSPQLGMLIVGGSSSTPAIEDGG